LRNFVNRVLSIVYVTHLIKQVNDYATEIIIAKTERMKSQPPQQLQNLVRKRNKIIFGLFIYHGLRTGEIIKLQTGDIKLREGKIFIAGTKRSNERTLKIESHQVFDLLDYVNDTRKQILQHQNITTAAQDLFLNLGDSDRKNNLFAMLLIHLQKMNNKIKTLEQIRASVIVHWLKLYNLRKVQIMAGHRYISSTENYNLDDLKEDIKNFHPF